MRYISPSLTNVHHLGPDGDRNISGTCSVCGVTLLAWLEDSERIGPTLTNRFEALFRNHVEECHPRVVLLREIGALRPNHARKRTANELLIVAG
jgi:hypothetical protein